MIRGRYSPRPAPPSLTSPEPQERPSPSKLPPRLPPQKCGREKPGAGLTGDSGALPAASGSAEAAVETVGVTSADGGRFKRNGVLWTERRAGARRVICRVQLRRRGFRRSRRRDGWRNFRRWRTVQTERGSLDETTGRSTTRYLPRPAPPPQPPSRALSRLIAGRVRKRGRVQSGRVGLGGQEALSAASGFAVARSVAAYRRKSAEAGEGSIREGRAGGVCESVICRVRLRRLGRRHHRRGLHRSRRRNGCRRRSCRRNDRRSRRWNGCRRSCRRNGR